MVQAVSVSGCGNAPGAMKTFTGAKLLSEPGQSQRRTLHTGVEPGQAVQASWSRDAMIRHEEG